ncbi:Histidine kinase [Opitutaceae bacterium TAV1]|nr:Histidine kinase [Opitutaceae bacterium TAV1]
MFSRLVQIALDPRSRGEIALQCVGYSTVTGAMLGLVDPGTPVWVMVALANVIGALCMVNVRCAVLRVRGFFAQAGLLAAGAAAGGVAALALLSFCPGLALDRASVLATTGASLFLNVMYVGLVLERRRAAEAQRVAEVARIRLLQAQIGPHFLSNTLANVAALLEHSPSAARDLMRELIDYLEGVLVHTRQEEVTLADELDTVESFLEIQRIRMGAERLRMEVDVPVWLRWQPVMPLLLLPLVENAVRHGVERRRGAGVVRLRADAVEEAGRWWVEVVDEVDGAATTVPEAGVNAAAEEGCPGGHGMALGNIRERLRMRYGSAAALELRNRNGQMAARLTLPLCRMKHEGETGDDSRLARWAP